MTDAPSPQYSSGIAIDPAELWEEWLAETPKKYRTPQSAMAFAVDRLRSSPTPQIAGGVRDAFAQCAKIAIKKALEERAIFEQAVDDRALSNNGRISIQDRALARETLAKTIAREIERLSPQAQAGETEYIVSQHIGWLKQYVQGMTADNWRDMQLRAARQLDELSGCVGVAQGSGDRGEFDPADIWDAYCDEVPEQFRSCQGAMAFALDYSSPPAALPAGEVNLPTLDEYRNNLIEECAKMAEPWAGFWLSDSSTEADRAVVAVRTEIAAKIRGLAIPSTDREVT